MAKKIKMTRPELKRHRDALHRFDRYLPMLKLKQQQLQIMLRQTQHEQAQAERAVQQAQGRFDPYRAVLADRAGLNVEQLAQPTEVITSTTNIAGVAIPVYEDAHFAASTYSLFVTPAWVDRALADLRELNRCKARVEILRKQFALLHRELTKIIQRVNLFEKVKIPEAREAIRVIRIHLGDEMTAAVGRAKIAKGKISEAARQESSEAVPNAVSQVQESPES